jgi:phosphoglycolate phosphatase
MARFELLVLDLDGTLVDSQAILVNLVNAVLETAGYLRADGAAVAATIGLPLEEVMRRATPAGTPAPEIDELCRHYRRRADTPEFVRQFRLYPDVAPTLTALHGAGTRLMIATSKGRATTVDIVRHCAIDGLLDEIIGGDCVTQGKPHPEMVHRARHLSGIAAERTLVVGDTSFDIEMGQAARAATCAVTYGMHPEAALRRLRPDFLIDRFQTLADLVIGREE